MHLAHDIAVATLAVVCSYVGENITGIWVCDQTDGPTTWVGL